MFVTIVIASDIIVIMHGINVSTPDILVITFGITEFIFDTMYSFPNVAPMF